MNLTYIDKIFKKSIKLTLAFAIAYAAGAYFTSTEYSALKNEFKKTNQYIIQYEQKKSEVELAKTFMLQKEKSYDSIIKLQSETIDNKLYNSESKKIAETTKEYLNAKTKFTVKKNQLKLYEQTKEYIEANNKINPKIWRTFASITSQTFLTFMLINYFSDKKEEDKS